MASRRSYPLPWRHACLHMENLPLAPLDIVIFLTLLVGAVRGFTKGLVFSVASLVGLAGGIAAAAHGSHLAAEQLAPHVSWSANSIHMASLAITFLAVVVVVQLVAKLIEKALDLVAMGFVNKLAGAVFGLAKMWLILSFVILLVTSVTGSRSWIPNRSGESVLLGPVEAVAPMLAPNLDVSDLQVPDLNGRPGLESEPPPGAEDDSSSRREKRRRSKKKKRSRNT